MTPRAAVAALDGEVPRPAVAVRVAACERLAGCTGRRAIEALVAALDDGAAPVRGAATAALARSAGVAGHGWRLAHAAFHRRADVRAAALEQQTLRPELLVELLADEDDGVRHAANRVAGERVQESPALVGVLLAARRRGVIDDTLTRALLCEAPWLEAPTAILRLLPKGAVATTSAPSSATTDTATSDVATLEAALWQAGDDLVIELIAVAADDAVLVERMIDGFSRAWRRRQLDADDRRRIGIGVAVVAAMGRTLPTALLALGVIGEPALIGLEAIPVEQRRAALVAVPALRLPGRAVDAFAIARNAGLLTADAVAFVDVVDVIAGLVALEAEGGWTKALGVMPLPRLAERMARSPSAALLAHTPAGGSERVAWLAFLRLVGMTAAQLSGDEALDEPAWLQALTVLPADGLFLVDDLEASRPGSAARLLTRAIDGDPLAPLPDDPALVEQDRRRRERALDALVARCGAPTRAGLLRVGLDAIARGTHGSGAADVVAALGRAAPLDELAAVVDALDPGRQARGIEALLVAVAALAPGALAEARRHVASPTWSALLRRDAPPRTVDVDALTLLPWPALTSSLLQQAATARVCGVADLVLGRIDRGDVPAAADVAAVDAALLCAWDPPHRVARGIAAAHRHRVDIGVGVDATPPTSLLQHLPTALLPPRTVAMVLGADDVVARLVDDTAGGLRAEIDLALAVDAPWAVWWLQALGAWLGRRGAADRIGTRRLLAEVALQRLAGDLARGTLLTDDDPRRPILLAMLQPPPAATTTPTTTATVAGPWPTPLSGLLTACAVSVASTLAWSDPFDDDVIAGCIDDALIVGGVAAASLQALAARLPPPLRERVCREALRVTTSAEAQAGWLRRLPMSGTSAATSPPLASLQAVLRWGGRQAIALCGAPFSVALSADGLGHTRLGRRRIVVNPLPLLQGERDGDAIVRGLILHELGHHRHHGGDVGLAVWRQAQDERLHDLLNLVADEHLERNLRALAPQRYGAPLKTLAAWAFQHMHRELPWTQLLSSLGPAARAVLVGQRTGVARRPDDVTVDVGTALTALARRGSSLSRFMRALRMGKADTSGDPKVREALQLFPAHTFRAATMPELLAIARRLRSIFGDETALLQAFDFHRLADASDDELSAAGVDSEAIVPEAPAPRPRLNGPPRGSSRGRPGGRGINVDDDVGFEPIDAIERVPADVAAHRQVATVVRRPAALLRRHLLQLGQGAVVERRRLSGRRLDRSALVGSVLKGDPRLLASRRTLPSPDVFVGVAIDCSGSMDGDNLERAMSFAVLLAEAARGLPDIDARFFGFTDDRIFDAGDARRCAVTSLSADGGNNDAAALAHVARVARRSRRQTSLLVMISDGAPTECSVPALRGLVQRLEARGHLCAQVAVEAIDDDDICFDRHILLEDDDLSGAARRFGAVIEALLAAARTPRQSHAVTSPRRHQHRRSP